MAGKKVITTIAIYRKDFNTCHILPQTKNGELSVCMGVVLYQKAMWQDVAGKKVVITFAIYRKDFKTCHNLPHELRVSFYGFFV